MMKTLLLLVTAISTALADQAKISHIKAAEAEYRQGKTAQASKQFLHASDCFNKAIEIEPTFLDAYQALIAVYLESGQRLEAARAITQFLEIQPGVMSYRLLLGGILLEQQEAQKALAQFSLVLRKDPVNVDGLLGFARAARQLGMEDRANEAMDRGRKQYPNDERFKSLSDTRK